MTSKRKPKSSSPGVTIPKSLTLADLLTALERDAKIPATRTRDLRSAVRRVADLLGQEPSGILLDLPAISARLAPVNPITVGAKLKTIANIRSGFLSAVKASGLKPVHRTAQTPLSPAWRALTAPLGKRAHIGLSRFARYASAEGIEPARIDDAVIEAFMATVRAGSLHRKPNDLHRHLTRIWNQVAERSRLRPVAVATYRPAVKRVEWTRLSPAFRKDVLNHLAWCGGIDVFAADARSRALAPRTLQLRRDQIHAAVSALVESGVPPAAITSLADLIAPENFKRIMRQRKAVDGPTKAFDRDLAEALVQIGREWVKPEPTVLTELKRLVGKLPKPATGLSSKNKTALRQFDDPAVLRRLIDLPNRLWIEVKREATPNFRTLAKAQVALGIAILIYMPIRAKNLTALTFGVHLFLGEGAQASSTLEVPAGEMKNNIEMAFDIPSEVAKMLLEYRDRIAAKVIGHRPDRVFVNADGSPKSQATVAWLIKTHLARREGIVLTPHQFRHLSATVMLNAEPGAFETVRQLLGHKNIKTSVNFYAGVNTRRAARHHQHLIERTLDSQRPAVGRKRRAS
jgi:integrase